MSKFFNNKQVNNKQKNNKKSKYIVLAALLLLVSALSVSYAVFTIKLTGKKNYTLTIGTLDFSIDNEQNAIRLMNAYPMTDEEGKVLNPYTFTLTNTGTVKEYYKISLIEDVESKNSCTGCTFLNPNKLRYSLTVDGVMKDAKVVSSTTILDIGELAVGQSKNYELRIWLNQDATIEEENKYYYGKIKVDASQETITFPANEPELTSGMIPVTYDESKKTWNKADVTEKWYDYNTQWWANAVTVTEATRDDYMALEVGKPINIDDINTMWVWIPRYEYQYTNLGTNYAGGTKELPGEIKVNFIPSTQTSPSDSTKYKIPEGFKFGNENLSGFWMAKFETSTLETCTIVDGSVGTDCDLTTFTPQVRPNVTSWRGARVSTFFQASRLMQDANNAGKYGFDTVGTGTMDVHMLKNTEWGIVTMLSQSKYGKYGNPNYEGANKEVYQNKSSSYITGSSNGTPSTSTTNTQVTYDISNTGYGASTTGTIYGVYDMSGGAYEYVMGNYNKRSGWDSSYNSGFEGLDSYENQITGLAWPNNKYYDLYTANIASDGYKAGDATHETSGWYSDDGSFVDSGYPWFMRGGYCEYDGSAGVFNVIGESGPSLTNSSFRLAIKP